MGHKIAEAIIENGILKYVDKKLPSGKLTVHIIYDESNEITQKIVLKNIVEETSGIYKGIDVEAESKKLRDSWERNVC